MRINTSVDEEFAAAKAFLFVRRKILVYFRDNNSSILCPNMWDIPGGGREKEETPYETLTREIEEEFSLKIVPAQIYYQKTIKDLRLPDLPLYIMFGKISKKDIPQIKFGNEGQYWELMDYQEFLNKKDVVPKFQNALLDFIKYQNDIFNTLTVC